MDREEDRCTQIKALSDFANLCMNIHVNGLMKNAFSRSTHDRWRSAELVTSAAGGEGGSKKGKYRKDRLCICFGVLGAPGLTLTF